MTNDVHALIKEDLYTSSGYPEIIANLLATKEGVYLDVSKSVESIFGYTTEEIKALGRNKILLNDAAFQEALKERDRTGTVMAEITGIKKDGTLFPILWHATIFKTKSEEDLVNSVIIDLSDRKKFEQKAREDAYNLDLILENTEEAFLITDADLRVVKYNQAYINTLRFVNGKHVSYGTMILDYVADDRKAYIKSNLDKVLQGEVIQIKRTYGHEGNEKVFETTIRPLKDGSKVIGTFTQIKDITEPFFLAENLRVSKERFELAAKASYDIIWDADFKNRTIYLSESVENNLGIKGPLLISFENYFQQFLHPKDIQEQKQAMIAFIKSNKQNADLPDHRLVKTDGSFIYTKAKMHAVRDEKGFITRIIGVITDITNRKIYEQSLKALNDELQKKTERLTQSNAELERFAYIASHDLQEPLRMISSFLSLIHKRYNDQLDDTGRQYIQFAVDGSERMKRLILNLLDFSRVGQTPTIRERINTNNFVKGVVEQFALAAKEKNAEIIVGNLPDMVCVKSQMGQVIQNLISNALKYSTKQPRIEIGGYEEAYFWHFFVRDNGIGIDAKYFEKIFIVFQKLHPQNEYPGTGIGLAIVKKIIDQHGGKVWVESEPKKGSTFHFTIEKTNPINEKTHQSITGRGQ